MPWFGSALCMRPRAARRHLCLIPDPQENKTFRPRVGSPAAQSTMRVARAAGSSRQSASAPSLAADPASRRAPPSRQAARTRAELVRLHGPGAHQRQRKPVSQCIAHELTRRRRPHCAQDRTGSAGSLPRRPAAATPEQRAALQRQLQMQDARKQASRLHSLLGPPDPAAAAHDASGGADKAVVGLGRYVKGRAGCPLPPGR
eukprot:scaffold1282_cov105-Isochrysis_galbana.AAC.1